MLLRSSRSDTAFFAASAAIAIAGMFVARSSGAAAAWIALAVCCGAAIVIIAPRFAPFAGDGDVATVAVSAWGVRHTDSALLHEAVSWDDLAEVDAITTGDDEAGETLFLVLRSRLGNTVVIPHTLAVESGVISALHDRLRGFDDRAFGDAIASYYESLFVLWRVPAESAGATRRVGAARIREVVRAAA